LTYAQPTRQHVETLRSRRVLRQRAHRRRRSRLGETGPASEVRQHASRTTLRHRPDNLWAPTATHHAVIELKTGVAQDYASIAKKDTDQLGGAVRWNKGTDPGVDNVTVMLHPINLLDSRAIPVPGRWIITPPKLAEPESAVEAFATALAHGVRLWASEQAVAEQLAFHRLTGERTISTYSVTARDPN
jgi:hypothetical protein